MKVYKFWGKFTVNTATTLIYDDDDILDQSSMALAIKEDLEELGYEISEIDVLDSKYEKIADENVEFIEDTKVNSKRKVYYMGVYKDYLS